MASENFDCYPKIIENNFLNSFLKLATKGECILLFLKAKNEQILKKLVLTVVYIKNSVAPFWKINQIF